jgi:hypothetical protein
MALGSNLGAAAAAAAGAATNDDTTTTRRFNVRRSSVVVAPPTVFNPEEEDDQEEDTLLTTTATTDTALKSSQWIAATTNENKPYWYHAVTRATRWELPSQALQDDIEHRLALDATKTQQRLLLRKQALQKQHGIEAAQQHVTDDLAREATGRVTVWAAHKNLNQMLASLHEFVDVELGIDGSGERLTSMELKRGYLKAVRVLHPDKNPHAGTEERIVLTCLFEVVTAAYQKFRTR